MFIPVSALNNETIDTYSYSIEDNFIVNQEESELALFYDSLPSKTTRALICDNGLCEVEKIEIGGITTYYQYGGLIIFQVIGPALLIFYQCGN